MKANPLVPPAIAPSKCTIPPMFLTAGAAVPNGAPVRPFCSVSAVVPLACGRTQAPSSDVKHWALENAPISAWTVATPLGWMNSPVAR